MYLFGWTLEIIKLSRSQNTNEFHLLPNQIPYNIHEEETPWKHQYNSLQNATHFVNVINLPQKRTDHTWLKSKVFCS